MYFGPNNLSQIDVKKVNCFVSQEKAQGRTKNPVDMTFEHQRR